MKHFLYWAFVILFTAGSAGAGPKDINTQQVEMNTSKGKIVLELYPAKAPETVKNFLMYVDSKFYDNTLFHRVIPSFMIQGGGFTGDLQRKSATGSAINNEADNGLNNDRGTIAMARTGDPHSATAQFFINSKNNDFLNFKRKDTQGWGYAVFGRVVKGMQVVDAISQAATGVRGPYRDVPIEPIVILSVRRLK